ncbi:MAG: hypothetical protein GY938_27795 [Ketobacter sp.]|nr:hypothetical protein [Ketobacter sp.]
MRSNGESGAALIVALLILLMVTLIGMTSLKSGLFHERMAFNAQAEELTFQAAETAINGVIAQARFNGSLLTKIMDSGTNAVVHCVTSDEGLEENSCSNDQTIDARDSILAQSSSLFNLKKPLVDSDAGSFLDYQFSSEGHGRFVQASMPFSNTNYQEWRKIGPGSGQFSDDLDLLGLGNAEQNEAEGI